MSSRFGGSVNFSLAYCWMKGEEHEKKVKLLVAQSCPVLCDPMDCSSPVYSVDGILQARILERVAIPFSRRSYQPRNTNPCLLLCRQILYHLSHQESQIKGGERNGIFECTLPSAESVHCSLSWSESMAKPGVGWGQGEHGTGHRRWIYLYDWHLNGTAHLILFQPCCWVFLTIYFN